VGRAFVCFSEVRLPYSTAVGRTETYLIDEVMSQRVINQILGAFQFYT